MTRSTQTPVRLSLVSMSLLPQDPAQADSELDDSRICTPEHCFHAFDTLFCSLTFNSPISPKFPDDKYPLFVTWNVRPSRPGRSPRLRGCIGSFEPHPLHEGLAQYALISAFKDYRFSKITKNELDTLACSISLLTDFEDASSYLDWTVGVHGIHITFPHPLSLPAPSSTPSPLSSSNSLATSHSVSRQIFSATYLPEIASEEGWDKIEAVDSAIHKAGWTGRISEDIRRSVKLRRYQSRKCTVTWSQFVEWRKLNGGKI